MVLNFVERYFVQATIAASGSSESLARRVKRRHRDTWHAVAIPGYVSRGEGENRDGNGACPDDEMPNKLECRGGRLADEPELIVVVLAMAFF
jgi:hypothetical protein